MVMNGAAPTQQRWLAGRRHSAPAWTVVRAAPIAAIPRLDDRTAAARGVGQCHIRGSARSVRMNSSENRRAYWPLSSTRCAYYWQGRDRRTLVRLLCAPQRLC
ncbi:hypothetical protein [Kibdelosporangium philippinense]|uniref:hypothetical protein n=1 Tax=Kibdelosporangium philippinense TaxID=211113 RepID=UPI003607F512